jgi:flavin-dependent dehydrogenase
LIVGAGPAGSALAARLARGGHSVLLLDRARFPRDKPCSEYLSPGTVRALDELGVLDRVLAANPARLAGMRVAGPDGVVMEGRFIATHDYPPPFPWALSLPRRELDQILRDAAATAGAEVREGVAVEELIYAGGAVAGVVARDAGGSRGVLRARVVVGADGLRSVVARRLGGVHSIGPRRVAFTAHVADVAGVRDWGELHVGREGYVGLGPVGGGVTTIALVLPLASVRRRLPDVRRRFFTELDRFPGLAGRVRADRLTRPVLVTGPFARWSRRPVADGALLVGDAADFFDPFTGQGIFAAVHGAALAAAALAEALAQRGPVLGRALAGYRHARWRAFAGKWLLERAIGLGVGWPALAQRVIGRLARRPLLADLLVGAAGNFVPARAVLAPRPLLEMLW